MACGCGSAARALGNCSPVVGLPAAGRSGWTDCRKIQAVHDMLVGTEYPTIDCQCRRLLAIGEVRAEHMAAAHPDVGVDDEAVADQLVAHQDATPHQDATL